MLLAIKHFPSSILFPPSVPDHVSPLSCFIIFIPDCLRQIQIRSLWIVRKCLRIEIKLMNSDAERSASTRGRNISVADWSCVVNIFCPHKLHNYSLYLIKCTCFSFLPEIQLWCSHKWICSRRRLGPRGGWGGGERGVLKFRPQTQITARITTSFLKSWCWTHKWRGLNFRIPKGKWELHFCSGLNPV